MPDHMTHWERVRAALEGDEVDRPPVSMWRHFYGQEASAQGLAEAMLAFQHQFDWDFMKVNARASYHAEDWGVKLRFSESDSRGHQPVDWPVKQAKDWEAIQPLAIHRGVLGEQLEALRLIAEGLDGQAPFVMTVFTAPLDRWAASGFRGRHEHPSSRSIPLRSTRRWRSSPRPSLPLRRSA